METPRTEDAPRDTPSPLLGGIYTARRPTGPVLGVVVVLLIVLVGQFLGVWVLAPVTGTTFGAVAEGPTGLREQLTLTLSFLFMVGLLAAWVWGKEGRRFRSLGFPPVLAAGRGVVVGAVVALVLMTFLVLLPVGIGQLAFAGGPRTTVLAGVLVALAGFVVQGSAEEILTRGYLMQVTYRKWGLAAAVALQALVFMALHGVNVGVDLVALVNLVLVALLLAFWALAEGGLWGVCAFHAVWNWAQGNVYGVEVSGERLGTTLLDVEATPDSLPVYTGGAFGIEGSVFTTVVLALALAVAVRAFRRRGTAG